MRRIGQNSFESGREWVKLPRNLQPLNQKYIPVSQLYSHHIQTDKQEKKKPNKKNHFTPAANVFQSELNPGPKCVPFLELTQLQC